ncbi:MAG: hypothetical protein AAF989_08695, partial [Planctomycetota bacterium]
MPTPSRERRQSYNLIRETLDFDIDCPYKKVFAVHRTGGKRYCVTLDWGRASGMRGKRFFPSSSNAGMVARSSSSAGMVALLSASVLCISVLDVYSLQPSAAKELLWSPQQAPLGDVVDLLGDKPLDIAFSPVRVPVGAHADTLEGYAQVIASSPRGEQEPIARSRVMHASKLAKYVVSIPQEWLRLDEQNRVIEVDLVASILS